MYSRPASSRRRVVSRRRSISESMAIQLFSVIGFIRKIKNPKDPRLGLVIQECTDFAQIKPDP